MSNVAAEASEDQVHLAERINIHHAAAQKHDEDEMMNALAAGVLLLEAKEAGRHGEWLLWLELHFTGSTRTAQRYMRVARYWPRVVKILRKSDVSCLGVRTTLHLARSGQSMMERRT